MTTDTRALGFPFYTPGSSTYAPTSDSRVRIDVRETGAIGDGVADDTEAIQRAFTAVKAVGGGVVWMPAGVYIVTPNVLAISSNTVWEGVGYRSHIKLKDNAGWYPNILEADGDLNNVTIRNLRFDQNVANNPVVPSDQAGDDVKANCVIIFNTCSNIEVSNCIFDELTGVWAFCVGTMPSSNIRVLNNTVNFVRTKTSSVAGSAFVGTGTNCAVTWTAHGYATGNRIKVSGITTLTEANGEFQITVDTVNTFHYTIVSHSATGAGTATVTSLYDNTAFYIYANRQTITGNSFYTTTGLPGGLTAIEAHAGSAYVAGNQSVNYSCIAKGVSVNTGAANLAENQIVITGNTALNASQGINVWPGTSESLDGVDINHNIIFVNSLARATAYGGPYSGSPFQGIGVNSSSTGTILGLNITHNSIRFEQDTTTYSSVSASNAGISLNTAAKLLNVIVQGNRIVDAPCVGIGIEPMSGVEYDNVRILDNVMVNCGYDLNATGRHAFILGDTVGTGTIKNIYIDGNHVHDTGAPAGVSAYYVVAVSPSTVVFTHRNSITTATGTLARTLTNVLANVAATTAPAAGTWSVGQFVWNTAPSGATPTIGWVCTVAGIPGTWVALVAN